MFVKKIKSRASGVLLYGITPPKAHTPIDKVSAMAAKSLDILRSLDIDALVVYDVQDESARTSEERPFPFTSALDPFSICQSTSRRNATSSNTPSRKGVTRAGIEPENIYTHPCRPHDPGQPICPGARPFSA